jgi:multimeric flavodoxin WrbA
MKTLIINGSPNGRRGNTEILNREFVKGMQNQPEIRYVAEEDAAALAAYMQGFDHWLFFFPLYVNAMPGIVKRLFERLTPNPGQAAGYFVQSGFDEAAHSDYLRAVLINFNRRMGYRDLGIVVAGGMAGVRYMPERMNGKTFTHMRRAGELYEQAGAFADESVRHFGQPYRFSKGQLRLNRFFSKIGLANFFWNGMLKKNKAYTRRFDKPFAPYE